jgi:hypothetical protein
VWGEGGGLGGGGGEVGGEAQGRPIGGQAYRRVLLPRMHELLVALRAGVRSE